MIPKILHKIWFGPGIDKLGYSDKWLNHFPEYKLIVWDNDTLIPYFDEMIHLLGEVPKCQFAWVGDLLRLLILRDHGGIYLDHDVEIFRNFEELLNTGSDVYLTFQYPECDTPVSYRRGTTMKSILSNTSLESLSVNKTDYINNNCIAAIPNCNFINRCIVVFVENYKADKSMQFAMSDWAAGPSVVTYVAEEYGIILNGKTQTNNNITAYNRTYLHPTHGIERLNKEKFNVLYNEHKLRDDCYTLHHHVFTHMYEFISNISKSEEEFNLHAHAFTMWYESNY